MTTRYVYQQLTLQEVANRKAPDGSLIPIVDALYEENEILYDAIFREANDTFKNMTTRWAVEPRGSWRKLNEGIQKSSGATVVLWDTIGMLEARAENDIEVIKAFSDPKAARMDEAMSFVRGLTKTMAETVIYGNSATYPERFTGLAPRLDATEDNVISRGGSTGLTSIFVVTWGPDTCYMLYPKNSKAGLEHRDLGEQTVESSSGYKFQAYCDLFTWKAGMAVKNEKAIGRVCNIESSRSQDKTFYEDDLIDLLNEMVTGPGTRIYCNSKIATQMQIRSKDKTNTSYSDPIMSLGGVPVTTFNGYPVRKVQQILNTESTIS